MRKCFASSKATCIHPSKKEFGTGSGGELGNDIKRQVDSVEFGYGRWHAAARCVP